MTEQITFDEKFMEEVMTKFSWYIKKRCNRVSHYKIQDPIWNPQDLEQEIYLHIWRFCTNASKNLSTDKKIWIPNIDMMIRNVMKNLLKRKSQRSDLFIDYLNYPDETVWAEASLNDETYDEIDLINHLIRVKNTVKPRYKKYFDEIVNPSDEFKQFIIENTPNGRSIQVTKRIVSKYFRIAYKTSRAIFKDLEKSFEYCSSIT